MMSTLQLIKGVSKYFPKPTNFKTFCGSFGLQQISYQSSLSGRIGEDKIVRSPFPDTKIPQTSLYNFIFNKFDFFDNQVALVDGITRAEVSFSQLRDQTNRISSGFRHLGFQKGDVLALCAPNSVDYGKVFFATIAAGGIVTTCNPTYTAQELNYQFKNSNAKYIATIPALLPTIKKAAENLHIKKIIVIDEVQQDHAEIISLASLVQDSGSRFEIESVDSKNDIAILPYSSGTTGLPKGVMLTHYNIVANCCQLDHPEIIGINSGDTVMSVLPFFHIYGMVVVLFEVLYTGAKQIILPKFEPHSFLSAIQDCHISYANLVPPLILFLAKHPDISKYNVSSLKRIMSGAAPLGAEVLQEACARTGIETIRQGYGLTETSPVTHCKPLSLGMEKPRSIVPPIPNQECKIIDLSTGESLGPNEEGEVVIAGPNIMKGYLNQPEETKKCVDADGWFYTGDVGYYDNDGHFYITDRLKELIKVKGLQVAPAELEALLHHHPKIADAAVVGVPHDRLGEAPRAFVVRRDLLVSEKEIELYVRENLAKHKWLVGGVKFIEEIPKSASGKILRRTLKETVTI